MALQELAWAVGRSHLKGIPTVGWPHAKPPFHHFLVVAVVVSPHAPRFFGFLGKLHPGVPTLMSSSPSAFQRLSLHLVNLIDVLELIFTTNR